MFDNANRRQFLGVASSLAAAACLRSVQGAEPVATVDAKKYQATVDKGIAYLAATGQADDGSFTKQVGIGITALAAQWLLSTHGHVRASIAGLSGLRSARGENGRVH